MTAATATPHATSPATDSPARSSRAPRRGDRAGARRKASSSVTRQRSCPTSARRSPRSPTRVPRGPGSRRPGDAANRRRPPAAPRDDACPDDRDARRPQLDPVDVAGQLLRADLLELHWIAFGLLETHDPRGARAFLAGRRAAAGQADDWITVDTLAHVMARGILTKSTNGQSSRRLVRSPSRWERGSWARRSAVIAGADGERARARRRPGAASALVRDLIGDAEPERPRPSRGRSLNKHRTKTSWSPPPLPRPLRRTTAIGHSSPRQPGEASVAHRGRAPRTVRGIRKRPNAPTTSRGGRGRPRVHRPRRRRSPRERSQSSSGLARHPKTTS